jgi:molybdopterin/thiamine biosynthesis adenylyltransferase
MRAATMKGLARQLADGRVHVGGGGRIGSGIVMGLVAARVGQTICNDPQGVEAEQLKHSVIHRRSDIGRAKVHALARFLDGVGGGAFEPLVAPNESPLVKPYLAKADLIISCANQLDARLYLEKEAIRLNKPCIQASAQDGRNALGGTISVWVPGADCSCFGCLFPVLVASERGEILLPTVTNTIAQISVNIATELLLGNAVEFARRHNVFAIDLSRYEIQRFSIKPRPGCSICRKSQRGG